MLKTSFFTREKEGSLKKRKTRSKFCAKLISGAVSAMMVLSLVPAGIAFAEATVDWDPDTNTLAISGGGELRYSDINRYEDDTTKVVFKNSNTITSIANKTFETFKKLEEVDFTNATSLTTIGDSAFSNCPKLETVNFSGATSLTTIGNNAFSWCCLAKTDLAQATSLEIIGDSAFLHSSLLGNLDLTNATKLTTIGKEAFLDCHALTSIILPESVTSIGESFIAGGSLLKTADLSKTKLATISNLAFANCKKLEDITLPESVTSIGNNAFNNCPSLTSINLPESVTSIGNSAFWGCEKLTNVNIPEKVDTINESTFNGCSSLTNIQLPNAVETIGDSAFQGCTNLTNVDIKIDESLLESINQSTFSGCTALKSFSFPQTTSYIAEKAFEKCTALATLAFHPDIEEITINNTAFNECSEIKDVYDFPGGSMAGQRIFPKSGNITFYETYKDPQNILDISAVPGTWTGTVPEKSALIVTEVTEDSYSDNIKNMINKYDSATVLDISLTVDDTETEIPELGSITITLNFNDVLPNTVTKVFHENDEGNFEEITEVEKNENSITFTTKSLSNFVFVGEEKQEPTLPEQNQNNQADQSTQTNPTSDQSTQTNPTSDQNSSSSKAIKTGDNSVLLVSGLTLIMLSAVGCWLFLIKKVKN